VLETVRKTALERGIGQILTGYERCVHEGATGEGQGSCVEQTLTKKGKKLGEGKA